MEFYFHRGRDAIRAVERLSLPHQSKARSKVEVRVGGSEGLAESDIHHWHTSTGESAHESETQQ